MLVEFEAEKDVEPVENDFCCSEVRAPVIVMLAAEDNVGSVAWKLHGLVTALSIVECVIAVCFGIWSHLDTL